MTRTSFLKATCSLAILVASITLPLPLAAESSSRTPSIREQVAYASFLKSTRSLAAGDCKTAKEYGDRAVRHSSNAMYKASYANVLEKCDGIQKTTACAEGNTDCRTATATTPTVTTPTTTTPAPAKTILADVYSSMAIGYVEKGECGKAREYILKAKEHIKQAPEFTAILTERSKLTMAFCQNDRPETTTQTPLTRQQEEAYYDCKRRMKLSRYVGGTSVDRFCLEQAGAVGTQGVSATDPLEQAGIHQTKRNFTSNALNVPQERQE